MTHIAKEWKEQVNFGKVKIGPKTAAAVEDVAAAALRMILFVTGMPVARVGKGTVDVYCLSAPVPLLGRVQ